MRGYRSVVIAWELLCDIAWRHPIHARLGRRRRIVLGLSGARASMRRRALGWHLVTPTLGRLARRPRGRVVWNGYLRLTRALGAGRRS